MSKGSPIEKHIPAFYKRSVLNTMCYGFIRGSRYQLHTVSVEQAVLDFMDDFKLTSDDVNVDSLVTIFARMKRDHKEALELENKQ